MKAHGIATAFGIGCSVRTAGLDPRPIGDSGSIPKVGTVAPQLLQHQAWLTLILSPHGVEADLKRMFNQESLSAHGTSGVELHMDGKIFESSFQNIQDLIKQPSHSPRNGPTAKTCPLDPNLPDLDIWALIGGFRPNPDELGYKPTWYRNLRHHRRTENWIHLIPGSDMRVIDFTNRWTCFGLNPETRPQIVLHRPTQERSWPRTTWRTLLGLLWIQQAKDPTKWPLDHQVTPNFPKRVDLVHFMESPRSNGSKPSSTRVWRPGEILRHLRKLRNTFPCTGTHRIKRIPLQVYFPYPDAFTLGAINHQRLLSFSLGCVLDTHLLSLDVPRHHTFMPKLSRLKHHHHLPYFGRFAHKGLTAIFDSFDLFLVDNFV